MSRSLFLSLLVYSLLLAGMVALRGEFFMLALPLIVYLLAGLGIQCLYCHAAAAKSRHAGIPAAQVCMNCHNFVKAPFAAVREEDKRAEEEGRKPATIVSAELKKLFDAVESGTPIAWVQVHRLPDFAYLDHSVHVTAGVTCQRCHGPVETMERVRQDADLTMGWCVTCHRQPNLPGRSAPASLDCAACHY